MTTQPCFEHHYIDHDSLLEAFVQQLKQVEQVAFDSEGNSLYNYHTRVCLIQLTFHGKNYIIDPLAEIDLNEFLDILTHKKLIIHDADYDLRMMRATFGFEPRSEVFDTMLAAQVLGYSKVGLSDLLQEVLGVTLSKKGQKSNWAQRPLTRSQLEYASADTYYLEHLAQCFEAKLKETDRYDWHKQQCERMVVSSKQDREKDPDHEWRIKGVGLLTQKQQAFVREIWYWREAEAEKSDRPPFKILGNREMIELALWAEAHPDLPLRYGPKLPKNCVGRRLAQLELSIERARSLRPHQWPRPKPLVHRPSENHEYKHIVDRLIKECEKKAVELGIQPSVLATRAALTIIAKVKPATVEEIMNCTNLLEWQAELILPILHETNLED